MTNEKNSIESTKRGFEASFADVEFYNKQTQDEKHLNDILEFLPIKSGMQNIGFGDRERLFVFCHCKRISRSKNYWVGYS